jgi:hypothetical protein
MRYQAEEGGVTTRYTGTKGPISLASYSRLEQTSRGFLSQFVKYYFFEVQYAQIHSLAGWNGEEKSSGVDSPAGRMRGVARQHSHEGRGRAVQCSAVQCSAVQCSAVQGGAGCGATKLPGQHSAPTPG